MTYVILVEGCAEIMTNDLVAAEFIAKNWYSDHNAHVMNTYTGEVLCEYPRDRG